MDGICCQSFPVLSPNTGYYPDGVNHRLSAFLLSRTFKNSIVKCRTKHPEQGEFQYFSSNINMEHHNLNSESVHNNDLGICRRNVIFVGALSSTLLNLEAFANETSDREFDQPLLPEPNFDSQDTQTSLSELGEESSSDHLNVNSESIYDATENSGMDIRISGVPKITRKVFFEVNIDGEAVGRFIVGLYGEDVPVGAARFAELAMGNRGISYRKREFAKITPRYIQNTGIRSFSLTGSERDSAKFAGGETADKLIEEMVQIEKRIPGLKNSAGAVSLITIDPTLPKPKQKLIAKGGGFEMVEEVSRPPPNGTSFAISIADSPELDGISLVVGQIIEGMDVVEALSKVQAVKENTSSPYFKAAKLIGDSRAVVAERGFNRPYAKIVISKCGEIPL